MRDRSASRDHSREGGTNPAEAVSPASVAPLFDRPAFELFARRAARMPDAVAVACGGEQLSYRGLCRRAERLAGELARRGAGPEARVAICVERGTEMVAGALAIWQAGAAYVPLDPALPAERLAYMLTDSGAEILLTETRVAAREPAVAGLISSHRGTTVLLDGEAGGEGAAGPAADLDNLAYVMYTSGSTGRPKGVQISHGNVDRFLAAMLLEPGLSASDALLAVTTLSFDISVLEIFLPLLVGARLVIAPQAVAADGERLARRIAAERITVMQATPATWHLLVAAGFRDRGLKVICGGEALPRPLADELCSRSGEVWNVYGPTEATVWATVARVAAEPGPVDLGRALASARVEVLDARLCATRQGEVGELCLGGGALARGYLHRPRRSAASFVPDPFSGEAGSRLYKTGNQVRLDERGRLLFLGRVDHQIKLRGFRVELGEIEARLLEHPGVSECVVALREDLPGRPALVAYLVGGSGPAPPADELRAMLGRTLPDYMVPARFVVLDALPLTANLKVDRSALPAPRRRRQVTAPRTPLERELARLWQQVLDLEHEVGVDEAFLELGGDSIRGALLVNRLQERLEEAVYVTALFDAPTVAEMAAYLIRHYPHAAEKLCGEPAAGEPAAGTEPPVGPREAARLRRLITPLAARPEPEEPRNPRAVFVLAPPRSGSTLFRIMLGGHPELFSPPELELLSFNTLGQRRAVCSGRYGLMREGLLRALMEIDGGSPEEAEQKMAGYEAGDLTVRRFYGLLQEQVAPRTLVDKTTTYGQDPEVLRRAEADFEQPLYLHLVRHPCAVVHSFRQARIDRMFRFEHPFSARQLAELLWQISHRNIGAFLRTVPAERWHRLTFEDLVRRPEGVLDEVSRFLGIELHPDMLDPYRHPRRRMTDGLYAESRMVGDDKFRRHRKIDPAVADRWRGHVDPSSLGEETRRLAGELGYGGVPAALAIPTAAAAEAYPLSFAQQRLWFLDQLEGASAYNLLWAYCLEGDLDVAVLAASLRMILGRHQVLRTRFPAVGGKPCQEIGPVPELSPPIIDLDGLRPAERDGELRRLARPSAAVSFDLAAGPLLRASLVRLQERDHVLLLSVHHIVFDGWSQAVLMRELVACYVALSAGRQPSLPALPVQYADFAAWQRSWLRGPVLDGRLAFWRRRLGGESPVLALPTDRLRPPVKSYRGAVCELTASADLGASLRALASERGATLAMVLMAAFHTLLHRLSHQRDLLVGMPVAGRNRREIEDLIGFFVNTLVIRVDLTPGAGGDPTFLQLLEQVRRRSLEAYDHQDVPFEKVVQELQPKRDLAYSPFFQVMFHLLNVPAAEAEIPGCRVSLLPRQFETSIFDLSVVMQEKDSGLAGRWRYNSDLFDRSTIRRLIGYYHALLAAVAADPGRRLGSLPMASPAEHHQLVVEWNRRPGLRGQPAAEPTVVELFEHQVARWPASIALVFEDRELTYRQLDRESARLAWRLRARGVGPEVKVGLCLDRSWRMIAALLGVLRAGGGYVPLDPGYPRERLAFLIADSGAELVLTETSLSGCLPAGANVFCLDEPAGEGPGDARLPPIDRGHLAYLIYTSGTTGLPKGVEITHAQLAAYVAGVLRRLALPPAAGFATVSTLAADLGNTAIFPALASGGAVHVISEERIGNADAFGEIMRRRQIDCVKIVPSHLEALLAAAARPEEVLPRRLLVLGGESSSRQLIRRIETLAPGCAVLNHYGPTETTVGVSTHRLEPDATERFPILPIGRPLTAARAYLLDRRGETVPLAAVGELYLGGRQVARGYLDRPARTAERFVPDPWSGRGARLYRTGDLARWRPGGELVFLGRADNQVKIRGFRVELAEIEAVLERHPAVQSCAVLVRGDETGTRRLVAYVVPARGSSPAEEIRTSLRARLPDYMVPSSYVMLETLPLTPNGKLDRKALPAPDEAPELDGEYLAPRTPAERTLAEIWSRVLQVERVGVHDNYFDLGGESILSIQIVSRANRAGLRLTPRDLFQQQTVAQLAAVAGSAPALEAEQGPITGSVPLTPIQHRFFELEPRDPHHYNHARLLELQAPVDGGLLRRAAARLVAHHDALRARYRRRGGEWEQRIAAPGAVPCIRIDLSRLADSAAEVTAQAARLQASLDLAEGPILRLALFELGAERADRLLIVVHHLAVDAVSWQILIEDLAAVCEDRPGALPPKTTSYREWARRLSRHADSGALAPELAFWRRLATSKLPRLPVDRRVSGGANLDATAERVTTSLDPQATRALLRDVPRAYRTGIDDVLLCALARAMAPWTGSRALLVDLEGHGREDLFEDLDLSRTVGWFTAVYPVLLDLAGAEGPGPALKAVKEQLRRVPNRGLGWGLLRYLRDEPALCELPPAEVSFNYLGRLDREVEDSAVFAFAPEATGPWSSPRNRRRYLINVRGAVTGGELEVQWIYSRAVHERDTVERLAGSFLVALRALIAHCTSPEAGGFTLSDFPLARLDQRTVERLEKRYREPGIDNVYALSPLQAGLLYHTLATPDAGTYITQMTCGLAGSLDVTALRQAWQQAIDRQPVLRTAFAVGDEMHQIVCRQVAVPWRELDWRQVPAAEQEAKLERLMRREHRDFDLARPPLLRLVLVRLAGGYQLVSSHHHVLLDGWSLPLLMREISTLYQAASEGRAPDLPPARPYADYIAWLERQDAQAAAAYWRRTLAGLEEPTPLPGLRPAADETGVENLSALLPAAASARIAAASREHRLTLNTLILGAWSLLLGRYAGAREVVLGVTVAGRPADLPGVETMIGSFINTLPLRVKIGGGPVAAWLRELQDQEAELRQVEHSSLAEVQALVGGLGRSLFDSIFVFENYPAAAAQGGAGALELRRPRSVSQAHYPLTVVVKPGPRLSLQVRYRRAHFDGSLMAALPGRFRRLVEALADGLDGRMEALSLLDRAERQQVQVEWNDALAVYPGERGVHRLFEEQAAARPDAAALSSGSQTLTYGELNRRANRVAHALRRRRVGPEVMVGVCLERGVEMVAAILGVLKAGGAYVPLDPTYPASRLALMMADTRTPVLLTQTSLAGALPASPAERILLDADWPEIAREPDTDLDGRTSGRALAYVMYTSGSTGRPKGVCVEHRSIVRLVRETGYVDFRSQDVFLQFAPSSFDAATFEIWGSLLNGARLAVFPPHMPSFEELGRTVESEGVTTLWLTGALFQRMVEAQLPRLGGVRQQLAGGEALSVPHVERYLATLDGERRLINGYGPTENTTFTCCHGMDVKTTIDRTVPIGRPIANTRVYVLDATLRPVPAGASGELYTGGDGLARGYLNDPALTAEKFVPNPFDGHRSSRLYRTGDLARYRTDGSIEFLGRADHQVKLHGFRIELGEIEALLCRHETVPEAVVQCAEGGPGGQRLVAYVVADRDRAPASVLRSHLRAGLPDYMVPAAFVYLDSLPLTPTGKVDRRALPAPSAERQAAAEYQAPKSGLEQRITAIWRQVLEVDEVGVRDNFFDLGGHSLRLLRVHARMVEELDCELSVTDLFQLPTIESLVAHLESRTEAEPSLACAARARIDRRLRSGPGDSSIAVIAMAGRFPGAPDVETFWQNLCGGVESIRFFSDEELRQAGVSEDLLRRPEYVKACAILDDVDRFDTRCFDYSPREAELIDPQQRLFLECAWEALERAGHDPRRYCGSIGVYAGVSMNTYVFNLLSRPDLLASVGGIERLLSAEKDFVATRVSYKLDLRGPSVDVQTACSTSLVAVHEACRSLLDQQCDMALAGGASVTVPVNSGYLYEEQGIRSPDGHCRPFAAEAQGTVSGNGVGVVVLKRLAEAVADGDPIEAVIRGTAINNDGSQKVGFTAPSVEGQAEVIALAQACAGVEPETVGYVEAHGTGTALGDPIEVAALERAFGERTAKRGFCALGSLKSNMGHLNAAAGVAGLIKTALALKHRRIPPSLHFERANPEIDFDRGPFFVNTECRRWRGEISDGGGAVPRRAGVSSFGMGGTNAHAVLEEAPPAAPSGPSRRWQLLVLSARSEAALEQMTANLAADVGSRPDAELADVGYTLAVGRQQLEHRRAVLCRDVASAVATLESGGPGVRWTRRSPAGGRRVVFLFPGQGAQYVDMGRGLYASEPAFRDAADACLELLDDQTDFDLRSLLYPRRGAMPDAEQLQRTSAAQPALFVVEYALAQLWRSWGIEPEAMIGHSLGELVAACVSGALALADALRLVALRGRLMQHMPAGAMLSVPLPAVELEALLPDSGLELAAINAPSLCAVSGPEPAVEAFARRLAATGVECRRLHTSHAFHSASMDGAVAPFVEAVQEVTRATPRIPYLSGVTGDWIGDQELGDPDYWGRQIRATVRFSEGLERLLGDPERVLLEVGPGRVLGSLARQHASCGAGRPLIASLRHPQDETDDAGFLLAGLGQLWTAGAAVDWPGFYGAESRRRVTLPTYPFQRQRYWIERRRDAPAGAGSARRADLADWFYIPSWRRSPRPAAAPAAREPVRCLAFVAGSELDGEVVARLAAAGREVVTVTPGTAFAHTAAGYVIDPRSGDDHQRLLAGGTPGEIVHLWTLGEAGGGSGEAGDEAAERCLERGFYSLLRLARALAEAEVTSAVTISVVTDRVCEVVGGEPLMPEKAAAVGPCRVIGLELSNLRCRLIDLPAAGSVYGSSDAGELVARELLSSAAEPVVAYRHGGRWVESFAPLRLAAVDGRHPQRLRAGGTYLITGGLGGMGLALADHLARSLRAKLVLTGRSALPDRRHWAAYLASRGEDDAGCRKIRAVEALEAAGAEVLVARADVADVVQMRAVVARVRARFGRIHGVIHAAGVPGSGLMLHQEPARAARVLAPKVAGSRVLERLFHDAELDFLVLCSSLNAVKGSPGLADYCAANACLGAFARRFAAATGTFSVAIDWNRWRQVGMAVDAAGGPLDAGQGISNREGVEVFGRVLERCDEPRVLVSETDLETRLAASRRSPAAESAPDDDAAPDETPAGHARPDLATEYAAPRTATERALVAAWETLFGIDGIGIHDDFYDLGGHSLLALQLLNRLNVTHGDARLSLRAIFDHPTVAQLAGLIEPKAEAPRAAEQEAPLRQRLLAASATDRRRLIRGHLRAEINRELGLEATEWGREDAVSESLAAGLTWILKRDLQLPVYAHELRGRLALEPLADFVATELERMAELTRGGVSSGAPVAIERPRRSARGRRLPPAHARNRRAVFVLTAPRSGSTLLRLMLGGHPALFCPPELSLLAQDGMAGWTRALGSRYTRDTVLHAFMAFMSCDDPAIGNSLLAELAGRDAPIQEVYRMIQDRAGDRTLVDKSPSYAMRLEVLERAEELFEDARYLHLVRHPYAVIESFVRQRMDRMLGQSGDPYAIAERCWSLSNGNIEELCDGLDRRQWLRIHYERLVREPAEVMAEVCGFLGLAFDQAMLRPYDSGQTFTGLGDPDILTHRTIEPRLAEVWKRIRLPRRLSAYTRELATGLGYELPREAGAADAGARAPAPEPVDVDSLSDSQVNELLGELLAQQEDGA